MFKSKTSMKIISLLAAVVLWLYVMGEVDPEMRTKITDIPVNFIGTEELAAEGLAVAYEDQITVNATVSGKRSDVNEAKKDGLTASVDVADCSLGENTRKIVVNLPVGLSLENTSETILTFNVDTLVYESKPVVIEFSQINATVETVNETTPWVLATSPEVITVSGAESSVGKVKKLIGVLDPSEAVGNESKWVDVPLTPVNSNRKEIFNISMNSDIAEVEIRELTIKTVELKLTTEDESIDLDKIGVAKQIKIAGTNEAMKSLETIEGVVTSENGKIYIDTQLPDNMFIMIGEENGKIIWN